MLLVCDSCEKMILCYQWGNTGFPWYTEAGKPFEAELSSDETSGFNTASNVSTAHRVTSSAHGVTSLTHDATSSAELFF